MTITTRPSGLSLFKIREIVIKRVEHLGRHTAEAGRHKTPFSLSLSLLTQEYTYKLDKHPRTDYPHVISRRDVSSGGSLPVCQVLVKIFLPWVFG